MFDRRKTDSIDKDYNSGKKINAVNIDKIYSRGKALSVLKKQHLFSGLNDHEIYELIEYCGIKIWKDKENIFKQNTPARSLFVILEGRVEVLTSKNGLISTLQSGEVLGELGVITSKKRMAEAVSASDKTITLEIQKSDLDFLLGKEPRISYILMRNMAEELANRFIKLS